MECWAQERGVAAAKWGRAEARQPGEGTGEGRTGFPR